MLDEQLLEEAVKVSGERTYSAAVARALEAYVRRARARQILTLAGSGLWEGDLAVVRGDRVLQGRVREAPAVYRTSRRRGGSR